MMMSSDDEKCPVKCFKLYISMLNRENEFLWQKALDGRNEKYYSKSKCGHNKIAKFMKEISEHSNLSKKYTNHCIRATSITILGSIHSDIDVTAVSGHKSISGLQPYKRTPVDTKIQMSVTINVK